MKEIRWAIYGFGGFSIAFSIGLGLGLALPHFIPAFLLFGIGTGCVVLYAIMDEKKNQKETPVVSNRAVLCPVCKGGGRSNSGYNDCNGCGGKGWIVIPENDAQKKAELPPKA